MEDVLDLYEEPYDVCCPVVCFDEQPVQLLAETRVPREVGPGRRARYDHEYERKGTANIFMLVEPLAGRRHVAVTQQRTMLDFAAQMQRLVDVHYPSAKRIRVVLDNLNTHRPASWLNMAEIELSVLSGQCLDRRIADRHRLEDETAVWEAERNQTRATIQWRFTLQGARAKLHHLYPTKP